MVSKKQQKQSKQQNSKVITDERFKSVHFDPKFKDINQKDTKTKIDNRFSGMFTDERFKIVGNVDKYGREIQASKDNKNKEIDDLYYMSDNEEEQQQQDFDNEYQSSSNEDIVIEEQEEDESEEQEKQKKQKKNKNNKQQQKKDKNNNKKKQDNNNNKKKSKKEQEELEDPFKGGFQWNEVSSSDEEIEELIDEGEEDLWEQQEKNVQYAEDTSSIIALQNYDWNHIGSKELMVLFSSFCQKVGYIKSVTVYPSKFGLEKMAEDEQYGPRGIWKSSLTDEQKSKMEKKTKNSRPIRTLDNKIIIKEDDVNVDVDIHALRRYEKQRLQYYYAVIQCDSVKTAVHIYENCNDQEFELTGLPLDLRFVPEEIEFPYEPKEKCNKMPAISEVKGFTNRSMGHTNVQLTWEEPKMDKFKFLDGKDLNDEDLDKIDWDQYLGDMSDYGSDQEDEDHVIQEEEEDEEKRLKSLKKKNKELDWRANFDKSKKKTTRKDDMEITFMSGFGDIQKNMEKRKEEEQESGWERYLRQKKEKRKAQKLAAKQAKQNDDDYFIDPSAKKNKEQNIDDDDKDNDKEDLIQKKKREKREKRKAKQALELLVNEDQIEQEGTFQVDVKDKRFDKIFTHSEYHLDPTHNSFKENKSGKYLQEQQVRRRKNKKIKLNEEEQE